MATTRRRGSYHHGDLPAALVETTLELIAVNGVQGFSVAEAARRTGVSISAPYRHFADREELLVACAVAACEQLRRDFEAALAPHEAPAAQLAAAIGAYVRFAAERRPMFEVLFNAGLEKARHPQLAEASAAVLAAVEAPARRLAPGGGDEPTAVLVQALTSLAQGYATLLLDGGLGELPAAIEPAASQAEAATAALLRGRSLLF